MFHMHKLDFLRILFIFGALLLLASTQAASEGEGEDNQKLLTRVRRIIGGQRTKTDSYRWVVSVQARRENAIEAALFGSQESYCGGTIIDKKWVVTAAHCIYTTGPNNRIVAYENPKYWHVRIDHDELKPNTIEKIKNMWTRFVNKVFGEKNKQNFYHVSKVVPHPQYVPGILENDIALLKLKEDIVFKSDSFLPIPSEGIDTVRWPQEGQKCTILGWGCGVADGPPTFRVQKLEVPVISGSQCRQTYVSSINLTDSKEFCAGYHEKNKGICPGDSGGPLACELDGRLHLAGVVSATHAKKPGSYPGIFTRVAYYADWIRSVMARF